MSSLNRFLFPAGIAATLAIVGSTRAQAHDLAGHVVHADRLSAADLAAVKAEIAAARSAQPDAFRAVAGVKGWRPEHYMKTRLRKPNVVNELKLLGPSALWPMVDALLHGLPGAPAEASVDERRVLEVALLDNVGAIGDKRALPVLAAAFEHGQAAHVVSAAAVAVGKTCGEQALTILGPAASAKTGAHRLAAQRGLGECRRMDVVTKLIQLLGERPADAVTLAAALGKAASSWALAAEVQAGTRMKAEADAMKAAAASGLNAALTKRLSADGTKAVRRALLLLK